MKGARVFVAVSAMCILLVTGIAAGSAPGTKQVTIDNFSFAPRDLTIKAGTMVTWTNKDDVPHTVVSESKRFRSGVLDTDGEFSYVFRERGTFKYYCSVHPHMTGRVIVQ